MMENLGLNVSSGLENLCKTNLKCNSELHAFLAKQVRIRRSRLFQLKLAFFVFIANSIITNKEISVYRFLSIWNVDSMVWLGGESHLL